MSLLLALTASGGVNYEDELSAGSYSIVGQTVSDSVARNDNQSSGAYVVSGVDLVDSVISGERVYPGDGHPVSAFVSPTGKAKKHRIDEFVTKAMSEFYEEITTPKIKKQAAKIVRPFIVEGVKPITIPSVNIIDWEALEKDAKKVSALLALWQEQIDLEDEEMLLMMIAA